MISKKEISTLRQQEEKKMSDDALTDHDYENNDVKGWNYCNIILLYYIQSTMITIYIASSFLSLLFCIAISLLSFLSYIAISLLLLLSYAAISLQLLLSYTTISLLSLLLCAWYQRSVIMWYVFQIELEATFLMAQQEIEDEIKEVEEKNSLFQGMTVASIVCLYWFHDRDIASSRTTDSF